jgi:hypothetical protein
MSNTAKVLYMEKRTPDGQLDFSQPQPPFAQCSEKEIFDYYFAHSGDTSYSVDQVTVYNWYKAQNFVWRAKTW